MNRIDELVPEPNVIYVRNRLSGEVAKIRQMPDGCYEVSGATFRPDDMRGAHDAARRQIGLH